MARQFAQKELLFYEPDEKGDDATSGGGHESENRTVECKPYIEEGHIYHGKFHRRELNPPTV